MANMEESRQHPSHPTSSDPEPFFPHPPPPAQSSQELDSQSNKRKKTSSSSTSSTSTSSKVKGGKATIKAHICPTCSSTFSRLFNLNQHVLIHTNNREFNCLEDGCSKVFLRSTDLTRHCKHVHRVDTKKDKRYSIQKKKLSDKNKQQTSTAYQPPPSPSASSSASSEHTNSTGASSYSTYSNSALERDSAFNKLAQEPLALLQRKPLPGDQSDNESMELDMREDYSDRIRPTYDSSRTIGASDSLSLPPIKTSFSQDLQSHSSAPSPQRSIVLPPLNLTHPPHIPSSQSQGSNHSFPSILTAPSSSSTFSSSNGNNGPLTPVLPSIRSQLPFSFNNPPSTSTSIPNQIAPSLALSNSRTQSFDRRIPLPPMKTSPSIL